MNEEHDRGVRLKNSGYVYIFKSDQIIKIGQSISPQERLENLNRTTYCGRANWILIDKYQTDWMLQVEQYVHMELIDSKVNKETFNCSIELARSTITASISVFNKRFGNA